MLTIDHISRAKQIKCNATTEFILAKNDLSSLSFSYPQHHGMDIISQSKLVVELEMVINTVDLWQHWVMEHGDDDPIGFFNSLISRRRRERATFTRTGKWSDVDEHQLKALSATIQFINHGHVDEASMISDTLTAETLKKGA